VNQKSMSNNQENEETAEQAGIRGIASQRLKALHRSKALLAQTRAASPPPLSTGQWLDDHLASLQDEQDEHAESGALEAKREWTARMRAQRLGLK
jgi:hypothetical protein